MKKVLKIIVGIFVSIYILLALGLTICLLNYNEQNIPVLGNKTIITISDDELAPNYNKGELVIVTKNSNEEIKKGDKIFFYNTYENEISVNFGKVIETKKVNETETTFTLEGDIDISSEFVIGKGETSSVYSNLGSIFSFLTSKWGFLFVIIFPILILFIYEIYAVIMEVKKPINEKK